MKHTVFLSRVLLTCGLACVLVLAACRRQGNESASGDGTTGQQAQPAPAAQSAEALPAPASTPSPAVQATMPDMPSLQVTTVDGKPFDLATHRGNWVVVNFWATWCTPCLKEMPELSALDAMRQHIDVIGLAYQEIEPAELQQFLRKHPVVYPVAIVDVYDPPKDFTTPRGLPATWLIAPDGKVAKHFLGPVTAKDVEDAIAAAGGPAPAVANPG